MTRAERLQEMERLYCQRAYSDIEMAERLSTPEHRVDRTTVFRDRGLLELEVPFTQDEDGRHRINRAKYLSSIRVDLREALSLYLAARRASQQTHSAQKHTASALEKLALTLRQPMTQRLVKAADVILQQKASPERDRVFETVADAWVQGLRLRVDYQGLHGKEPYKDTISPYLIEPSPWSDSVYVIGPSDKLGKIVPYKLDRIQHAALSSEPFTLPQEFDEQELLRHAWGIWRGDGEPVTVKLKFAPGEAARRVQESVWHPLEQVTPTEDGGCLWQAPIAEPREMVPWVRGWGADVLVLEPTELRELMRSTAIQLSQQYQVMAEATRLPHQIPYAKTNPKNKEAVHLLLYHLVDVGQVALTMWQDVLTAGIRTRLASMLELNETDCGRFLAFLAALHDLGKASAGYQKKYAPEWLKRDLEQAGLALNGTGDAYAEKFPHGTVTTWALKSLLLETLGLNARFAGKIAVALGGHHGAWPGPGVDEYLFDGKHPQWEQVRRDLVWETQAVFAPPKCVTIPSPVEEQNTFLTILSGLTSVADWIGSRNEECFGFIQQPMSTRQYALKSAALARKGLSDLGWIGWKPVASEQTFAEAFAYLGIESPRPLQQAVIDLACGATGPTLMILEAPTGVGKTEIALYVADRWLGKNAGRGLYVAMPTQATSNQMYTRVGEFLHRQYPDMKLNYHLVHGQAEWADDLMKEIELQGVGDDGLSHINAESWFGPRKRTLLAPFGVGTVDQALMSVLQTRHFFVRLLGLSHKVVIFDEVHAYDAYMNTLFHRLLTWLNAIGTSVIVLSATLPAQTRRDLVKAYTGQDLTVGVPGYPTLTLANSESQRTTSLPPPPSHILALTWCADREPTELANLLKTELTGGGCAAVICNTVGRAQAIYRALETARQSGELDIERENLILFHGRFPPIWRKKIEDRVRKKFEKGGQRPRRAIVVATQVIEQSLDIDFDLMISELAPVDLLIQRAGRLHRHSNNDERRYGLPRRLTIIEPDTKAIGAPNFGKDIYVYAEYILLRTYLRLRRETEIAIPGDTTDLIEDVYDATHALDMPATISAEQTQTLLKKLENEQRKAQAKAGQDLILAPHERGLLAQHNLGLEEDNPEIHHTLQVQTRDIDFSVTVVCLHQDESGLFVYDEDDNHVRIDLSTPPHEKLTKLLLQNAIAIQNKGIGKYLVEQPPPHSWSRNAALRYCRHAVFVNGTCDLPTHLLKLSQDFGLETIKKEAR